MRTTTTTRATCLVWLLFTLYACSTTGHLKPVTVFPHGKQMNAFASGLMSGYDLSHSEQYTYNAPYERVWQATKDATKALASTGKRPVVAIDEKKHAIQNGKIGTQAQARLGAGTGAWVDEFVTSITPISTTQTQVTVTRRLVGVVRAKGESQWISHKSNGKIERWVLTTINERLSSPSL